MTRINIRALELRHRTLDHQIHELDRRGIRMTPSERTRAMELKKQRLAAKDQLAALLGR